MFSFAEAQLVTGAVCIAVGLVHLTIGLQRLQPRVHLVFSVVAFMSGLEALAAPASYHGVDDMLSIGKDLREDVPRVLGVSIEGSHRFHLTSVLPHGPQPRAELTEDDPAVAPPTRPDQHAHFR